MNLMDVDGRTVLGNVIWLPLDGAAQRTSCRSTGRGNVEQSSLSVSLSGLKESLRLAAEALAQDQRAPHFNKLDDCY